MKRNNLYLSLILVVFTLFSCTHRSYRMQTQVNRDGSCVRSISVETRDSAFIAGDTTANPLPIQLDTTWTVECYNGQQKVTWPVVNFALFQTDTLPRLTIVASRRFPSVEAMAENFHFNHGLWSVCKPSIIFKKEFRWFYTYYIYTATYKELQDKGPVPLDNYLNKEEQMIWLQGNDDAFRGMNGIEMNDKLDKLEAKFGEWYNRSIYEINWEVIHHFASLQGDTACLQCLKELKNSVYKKHSSEKGDSMGDADIEEVCNMFDKACSTKYFSDLYKTNKEMMDALCEEKINIAEIFYHAIQFELTMPGRLLTSNAKVLKDDVVIWKIDGFRLLAGDYVLTAESRIINYWAFGITLFIMLFALGVFIKLYRKRS